MSEARIFIGIEAEGPNQGMRTLFVRGDVTALPDISSLLVDELIDQVYLGAGNIRGVSVGVLDMLQQISKEFPYELRITMECDNPEQIKIIIPYLGYLEMHHYVKVVFVIDTSNCLTDMPMVTDIKFVNDKALIWFPVRNSYTTKLNDARYDKDKEVTL